MYIPRVTEINTTRRQKTHPRQNASACVRCREKKKRCDQKLPRCHLCEVAGVECYEMDNTTKRQVRRGYVHDLERSVAHLESRLRELGDSFGDALNNPVPTDADPFISPSPSRSQASEAQQARDVANGQSPSSTVTGEAASIRETIDGILSLQNSCAPEDLSFSTSLLTEIMAYKATPQVPRIRAADIELASSSDVLNDLESGPMLLPVKPAAQRLVNSYFQSMNVGAPLLHEPTFDTKLELLYTLPREINLTQSHSSADSRIAVFFVFEIFAVAVLSIQKQEPSSAPTWLADRYHQTATAALNEAGLPHGIERIQALLLISQYYYNHPTTWAAWKTVGAALQLAVELGLHQDPHSEELDFLTLDTRRRAFWVAYAMDRNISTALCRPFCISDGAISTKFPSQVEDKFITPIGAPEADAPISGSKTISLHLFKYRQIQSEIRTALYEKPPPPYAPINLEDWQKQMHSKIDTWYQTKPSKSGLSALESGVIDTFEVTYNTALFNLYRPCPNIPSPSTSQSILMARSATSIIDLYRRFFCERQLTLYWQAMENLSSAGTALMFSYVKCPEVRETMTFTSLQSLIHSCSSVLWGMVERFPTYKGKRDAFDKTAAKVLSDIRAAGSATEAEDFSIGNNPSTYQFDDHQFGAIHDEFPSSTRDEPRLGLNPPTQSESTDLLMSMDSPTQNDHRQLSWSTLDDDGNADTNHAKFSTDLDSLSFIWDTTMIDEQLFPTTWLE